MQLSLSPSYLWVVFSVFSALVTADGQTNGQNAITYPLGGSINAGSPITIKWTPTTSGTITLHILKGPPDNLSDLGPIVAGAPNLGSFTWTVPSDYEDSSIMPTGNKYGIKIVDDLTGTFEYSPPFDMTVPAAVTATTSSIVPETTSITSQPEVQPSTTTSTTTLNTPLVPAAVSTGAIDQRVDKAVAGGDSTEISSAASSAASSSASPSSLLSKNDLTDIPDLGLIFGAASAGVGGLIVIIIIAAVWARVRSDKKKADYYGKSFRDRRSAFDSPTTRRHSRSSSSSSFGDRRASQLFNYPRLHRLLSSRTLNRGPSSRVKRGLSSRGAHHGRSSPPPPIPMMPPIQLRSPPPPLRGPLQVVNRHSVPDSPPPPLTPLPIAVTRAPPEPLNFGLQSSQPYKPRVYTPIRPGFEDLPL